MSSEKIIPKELFAAADYYDEIDSLDRKLHDPLSSIEFLRNKRQRAYVEAVNRQERAVAQADEYIEFLNRTAEYHANQVEITNPEKLTSSPGNVEITISGQGTLETVVDDRVRKDFMDKYHVRLNNQGQRITLIIGEEGEFNLAIDHDLMLDYSFRKVLAFPDINITTKPEEAHSRNGSIGKYLLQGNKIRFSGNERFEDNALTLAFARFCKVQSPWNQEDDIEVKLYEKFTEREFYKGPAKVLSETFPFFMEK